MVNKVIPKRAVSATATRKKKKIAKTWRTFYSIKGKILCVWKFYIQITQAECRHLPKKNHLYKT